VCKEVRGDELMALTATELYARLQFGLLTSESLVKQYLT
jgi:hypothetical protein